MLICLLGEIPELAVRSFRREADIKLFALAKGATLWNRVCQRVGFHDVKCCKFRCRQSETRRFVSCQLLWRPCSALPTGTSYHGYGLSRAQVLVWLRLAPCHLQRQLGRLWVQPHRRACPHRCAHPHLRPRSSRLQEDFMPVPHHLVLDLAHLFFGAVH